MAKHFLKTLIIFLGMIIFGLIGVFLTNHFDNEESVNTADSQAEIAK